MLKITIIAFITFLSYTNIFSQYYTISGFVKDKVTNQNLGYANIRVDNSGKGTAANKDGKFKIRLSEGNYLLIASYIGYKSDTAKISINEEKKVNFLLSPIKLEISEIIVKPDKNPAYEIIEKTIKKKKEIKNNINNYKYSAYTKGLIKTTKDFQSGNFSLTAKDTGKLKITGILENESRGFFKSPDNFKHFIVARKQTANTPPFINVLTGGNVIQSFYEDNLLFMNRSIPSPISDKALSYYYFYIEKETAINDKKVYQIYFATDNTADPGFYGKLFIEDSTFYLLKIDVQLNKMANPGRLFNYIKVYQQFSEIEKGIILPIDYRLFAEGNYLGLAKFGFELNTIMNSYEINTEIDDNIFDGAIISVLPDADKKDKTYWNSIQTIPNTIKETQAYSRIDSLENISKSFGEKFSILAQQIQLHKNLYVGGPLTIYSFNKVEGSALNFNLLYSHKESQRFSARLGAGYGFADKKLKTKFLANYLLGDYRTTQISFSVYDKLTDLFGTSNNYNKLTSTVLSLFSKYDFRDYFYTKGFETEIKSEIFPFLNLGLGFLSKTDKSAKNNSDFSFFYQGRNYSQNKSIYDIKTNAITASFGLDFRNYIEDGFFRRRINSLNYIRFGGSVLISKKDFLKSESNFSVFQLETFGSFNTLNDWKADFYIENVFSTGAVPFQMLNALSGNISGGAKNNSFRTLRISEIYGDKTTTLFFKHNFKDYLFRVTQIPILKDLQLQFSTYLNVAISEISNSSKQILPVGFKEFKTPFYELGFSIGHILIPMNFEFTWKLNYRGRNNFVFGINTFAL